MKVRSRPRRGRLLLAVPAGLVGLAVTLPSGASTRILEKTVNLDVAKRVRDRIESAGAHVVMTRTTDRTVALADRTGLANRKRVDLFVAVHNNAGSRTAVRTELYRQIDPKYASRSKRLAGDLEEAFERRFEGRDIRILARRGSSGDDYYWQLRETRMPAIIVEGAFLSNPDEAERLSTVEFRTKIAYAIADGILAYGKALVPTGSAPNLDPGSVVDAADALDPPEGSSARIEAGRGVRLRWTADPVVPVYRVYRSGRLIGQVENPSFGQALSEGPRMSFLDRWTWPTKRYSYRLRFRRAAGRSRAGHGPGIGGESVHGEDPEGRDLRRDRRRARGPRSRRRRALLISARAPIGSRRAAAAGRRTPAPGRAARTPSAPGRTRGTLGGLPGRRR